MSLFAKLIRSLDKFLPAEPIMVESQMERKIQEHLSRDGFSVQRQVSKNANRYDLICKQDSQTVCIELKMKIETGDIKQFDKYIKEFRDGFIVVCWQSSFPMKEIFYNVIDQSPVPVTMIELAKRYMIT